MPEVTEIRVHGVSGTPPRNMLHTDPVVVERRPPWSAQGPTTGKPDKNQPVEVSARGEARPNHKVLAYNWSKLTSGRPRHALWLLLLPYTFLNVAGWMLPPRQRGPSKAENEMGTSAARWMDMVIRLSGGLVTALFTLFTSAIFIDLVAAKCQPGTETCSALRYSFLEGTPGMWLFISTLIALVFTIGMGLFVGLERGRRGQAKRARDRLITAGGEIPAPQLPESDPAARLTITDPGLWHPRDLGQHLMFVHLGISALTVAWLLTAIRRHSTGAPWTMIVVGVASVLVFGVLILASSRRYSNAMARLSLLAAGAGLAAYIVAVIEASGLSKVGWSGIRVEEGLSQTSVWLTLGLAVAGIIVWLVGAGKKYSTSGSAAMIVLGGLVGSAFGAGVYTLVQRALVTDDNAATVTALAGMDWPAFGFLVYILILIGFVVFTMAFGKLQIPDERLVSEGLRGVTTKVRRHLGWSAVAALAGALFFVVGSFVKDGAAVLSPFSELEDLTRGLIVGLSIAVLLVVVLVINRYFRWKVAALAAVGITGLYLLISFGKITEVKLLGAVVRFDSLRELTLSLALLVPVGFIFSRLISTFRNREQRRGIAILWDLSSFWPRWYHPFAAPTYGPVAVPDLAALVRENAKKTDDFDGRVILAAHSQGSIIAMAALLTIKQDDEVWKRIAHLTYGNPTCHLYNRLFPGHFNRNAISELSKRLGGEEGGCEAVQTTSSAQIPRWRNLWRQSDPIGGDIGVPGVSSTAVQEKIADGHSSYETTDAFKDARDGLK